MQLNVINLAHRTDRMYSLQQEIMKQGIVDYKIWNGITGEAPKKGIAKAHQQIVA